MHQESRYKILISQIYFRVLLIFVIYIFEGFYK